MNRSLLLCLIVLSSFSACDAYEQDGYVREYVVEAYLVAGAPLPALKLSTTAPADVGYRFDALAVEGADVSVALLDDAGGVAARYAYAPRAKGVYGPVDPAVVRPYARYALEVDVPGAAPIRAQTFVPGVIEVLGTTADTLVYQDGDQFEVRVVPSRYPGRQGIYNGKLMARDTTHGMPPFYADLVEDGDVDPDELLENASSLVNEAFFVEHPDGSMTLRLPWVAVAFYGPNDVVVSAVDDNLYDFIRSRAGNGARSPGQLDNVIDHVDGGIGIFGSMATDTQRVFIRPPG